MEGTSGFFLAGTVKIGFRVCRRTAAGMFVSHAGYIHTHIQAIAIDIVYVTSMHLLSSMVDNVMLRKLRKRNYYYLLLP